MYDLSDHLRETEARGVHLDGVGRTRQRVGLAGGVDPVATGHVGLGGGDGDAGEFATAALRAYFRARGEVDLHRGLGRDDGADVTALHDDAPVADDLPLQGDQARAY